MPKNKKVDYTEDDEPRKTTRVVDPFIALRQKEGDEPPFLEPEPKEEQKPAPRPRKRSSKFAGDARITVLVKDNPKRAGTKSHKRFAEYKTDMTVEEALRTSITCGDLAWDVNKGYIRIS